MGQDSQAAGVDQGSLLATLLPAYQFEERHVRRIAAPPGRVLDVVAAMSLRDDPIGRALLGLRTLPAWLGRPRRGAAPARFSMAAFAPLGRRGDEEIAWGLVGRFWRPDGGLVRVPDAAAFRATRPAGTSRLVWSFLARPDGRGGTRLTTITRVHCPDRAALLGFAPYWALIRPFSGLIRRRLLADVARRAEAAAAPRPGPSSSPCPPGRSA